MENHITIGVDYYPEHWPRERWTTDIGLMKDFGVEVVRLAEFSWSKLEPAEGKFNFEWLDEVLELLENNGIKAVLGTPTAAPPAWLIQQSPEIQPIDSEGRTRHFGGRHHNCQSNKKYRRYIQQYLEAFAGHFGNHPNVIGWQVDNELGNSHEDLCYCDSCQTAFQKWLEGKYQEICKLNECWGTVFWSQSYQNFEQIQAPKLTVTGKNPSQMLDWYLFHSDLIVEFHHFQAKIIRELSPERFITHNMMGFSDTVNYYDLGKDLDFAAQDQYPGTIIIDRFKNSANLDLIRSVKNKSFWIMEQQSGITGWDTMNPAPNPGQLALWAMQSVAHGADTIVFFRWRSCSVGTEQYWHGLLSHSGEPTRYFYELKNFAKDAKPLLNEIHGYVSHSKVGIVFSYEQEYALKIQRHTEDFDYVNQLLKYYQALNLLNIPVDFVSDKQNFDDYDYLIAPLQYLMTSDLENKYEKFVSNGGNLILTMRTGVKDQYNRCMTEKALPGNLSNLLGIEVKDYSPLCSKNAKLEYHNKSYEISKWADVVTLNEAECVAKYASEYFSGSPAITKNRFGKGEAFYVATELSEELMIDFMQEFLLPIEELQLSEPTEGVEFTQRNGKERTYYFVLNHDERARKISIPEQWVDFYANQNRNQIESYGYQVYMEDLI